MVARNKEAIRDVVVMYGVAALLAVGLGQAGKVAWLSSYTSVMLATAFLWLALSGAQRAPGPFERFGISLGGLFAPHTETASSSLLRTLLFSVPKALKELGVALIVAVVVFPLFALGFFLWHRPAGQFQFSLPPDFLEHAASQLLVIALPEEVFFRGYVQTRLEDAWPVRRSLLFVRLSPGAWLVQSLLFSVIHLASHAHPARLAVFFPGLLFGWLRSFRGGVGAAVWFHTLSNLYSELLVRGWFGV